MALSNGDNVVLDLDALESIRMHNKKKSLKDWLDDGKTQNDPMKHRGRVTKMVS